MAGFKKRMKTSVQLRLSLALGIAILLTAVISGGITFYLALDEAREQIRNELRNKKINDSFHNWKKELFTRYQAKIHEDRFEVVKKPEPPKPKGNDQAQPKNGARQQDDAKKNSPK